jgi:hypothetical protein
LNVDIKHIGERSMTRSTSSRTLSVLLAAAFAFGLWLPTLSVPAAHAEAGVVVVPELA